MFRQTKCLQPTSLIPGFLLGLFLTASFFTCILKASAALADELSDPTRPPLAAGTDLEARSHLDRAQRTEPLDLSAVFFADGRRVAIINGKRLRERDSIEDAVILSITPSSVKLRRDDNLIHLELIEQDIKIEKDADFKKPAPAKPITSFARKQQTPQGKEPNE